MPGVRIVGVGGYTGGEIMRILLNHPSIEIVSATDLVEKTVSLDEFRPELAGLSDLRILPAQGEGSEVPADITVLATPTAVAMNLAPKFLARGERVIDISGDSRLETKERFESWYKVEHKAPAMLKDAVYGCCELFKDTIRTAKLLANPGCYPTASVLSIAPAVKAGLVDAESIIINAVSGISGAGQKPAKPFHFPEMFGNAFAYKVGTHPHTPEIELALGRLAKGPVRINFTPHVIPTSRGILATTYADLTPSAKPESLRKAYEKLYNDAPFVRLLPEGVLPQIKNVRGTNFCDVGFSVDERTGRLIAVSAIDNLIKGAAGLAVQNLNLMFGLDETEGLKFSGLCI